MAKIIAAINMSLDGICDHEIGIADDELHQHYSDLLKSSGTLLYGRITYQLMEYWPTVVKNPTGNKATDEFAMIMEHTPKIVFSQTLTSLDWHSARLATKTFKEEVLQLKEKAGEDVLIGSPSLIVQGINEQLVDELQLCIHPVIAGNGLSLFKNINQQISMSLIKTKQFGSVALVLYYKMKNEIN